jgi:MtN3 and saliva related transmembrane protein
LEIVTIVGSAAALCSMTSFVPQAWKIVQSGETKDISKGMYLLTVTGFSLWVTYGWLMMDWPIIVTNTVCGLLAAFILGMTLLSRAERKKIVGADT